MIVKIKIMFVVCHPYYLDSSTFVTSSVVLPAVLLVRLLASPPPAPPLPPAPAPPASISKVVTVLVLVTSTSYSSCQG